MAPGTRQYADVTPVLQLRPYGHRARAPDTTATGAAVPACLPGQRYVLDGGNREQMGGLVEAMIGWKSSSIFTASARLATSVKSERGYESWG